MIAIKGCRSPAEFDPAKGPETRFEMATTVVLDASDLLEEQDLGFVQGPLPANPLADKLNRYARLAAEEISALDHLCRDRRSISANATLVHESARRSVVFVVLRGVAFRYKILANGRRQILGYLMPGDMCDCDFTISNRCDHTVGLLTDAEVAVIPMSELNGVIIRYPRIGRALMLAGQSEGAVLRGWLLNMGQRQALQRIAHFLCEMSEQLYARQPVPGGSLPMPLSQHELADTVGLTGVHVNRCLQRLREEGVIAWGRKRVTIIDRDRLLQIADSDQPARAEHPVEANQARTFASKRAWSV